MILRLYAILLKLYPRQFRADFGDEMQTVFAEALIEHPSAFLFLRDQGRRLLWPGQDAYANLQVQGK